MKQVRRTLIILALWLVVTPSVGVAVIYFHGISPAEGCRNWQGEYEQAKRALPSTTGVSERAALLSQGAKAAVEIGEVTRARSWATEAIALLPRVRRDWNYGNIVHDAHLARGRSLLRQGDIAGARRELRLAGATPGSPQLNSFGPNMALASDLLKAGEKGEVIAYFQDCARFWDLGHSQLRRWELLVKLHLPPDFGANFLF